MSLIPNPVRGRHAYREPAARTHLLSATLRPAELAGHRITLAETEPSLPVAALPGPADLSLTDRSPVIAVLTPRGFRIVERWYDAAWAALHSLHRLPGLMRSLFETRAQLQRARLVRLEMPWLSDAPTRMRPEYYAAGRTHSLALVDPKLGPGVVRRAIVQRALAVAR